MIANLMNIDIKETAFSRIDELDINDIKFGRQFSDHMFIADYRDNKWNELRIVPYEKISMYPAMSCIHYGQSIFEGMKAYRNEQEEVFILRPKENWERMNNSAIRMCMPEIPQEMFMEGISQLLRLDKSWIPKKDDCSLYVRPFMFATDECIGVRPSANYRFMIITSPAGQYYTEPVRIKIETKYSRAMKGGVGYTKSAGNYGAALYPAKLAQNKGYHQLLWTDAREHKYIEEAGTMNFMLVVNDTLLTPELSTTILPGTTRDAILTLAREWGTKVEERQISVDEILEAHKNHSLKEMFGVGTAATIAHVALFGFNDKDYTLPAVDDNFFSVKMHKYLEALKRGKTEDKNKWMYKVTQ